MPVPRAVLRAAEFLVLFLAVPLLFVLRVLPRNPIPVLVAVSVVMLMTLLRDRTFDRRRLWNQEGAKRHWRGVVARAMILAAVLGAGVAVFDPGALFSFVRRAPQVWLLVMILYPVLSVYPQELIYRAFLFHRYQGLFGRPELVIAASGLAFGWVHILFGNWLSVALSAIGGVMFARTYARSRSLLLASIEHAIFGNFIWTIGLGEYFYHGAGWCGSHRRNPLV